MIIQVWSYEAAEGMGAEAMEVSKKLVAAHTKNGVPSRVMRIGTGTAAERKRIIMTMEFESLAAAEAYTNKDEAQSTRQNPGSESRNLAVRKENDSTPRKTPLGGRHAVLGKLVAIMPDNFPASPVLQALKMTISNNEER